MPREELLDWIQQEIEALKKGSGENLVCGAAELLFPPENEKEKELLRRISQLVSFRRDPESLGQLFFFLKNNLLEESKLEQSIEFLEEIVSDREEEEVDCVCS